MLLEFDLIYVSLGVFVFLLNYDWVFGDNRFIDRDVDYRSSIDEAMESEDYDRMNELMKKQSKSGSGFQWLKIFGMPVLILVTLWGFGIELWMLIKFFVPLGLTFLVLRKSVKIKNFIFGLINNN